MAIEQRAEHVFAFGDSAILAAGNTPFIQFCRVVEATHKASGSIVKEHVIQKPQPVYTYADSDDDIFSDDEMPNPFSGVVGSLTSFFMGSGTDESTSSDSVQTRNPQHQRHPETIDSTRIVTDTPPDDPQLRHRGEGPLAAAAGGTTCEIVDAPANVPNADRPMSPSFMKPVHKIPPGKEEEDDDDDITKPILQWYVVQKVYMWKAFEAYNVSCILDSSLMRGIQTGTVDTTTVDGLEQRLTDFASSRLEKYARYEKVQTELLDMLDKNKHRLTQAGMPADFQEVLTNVLASKRSLLPTIPNVAGRTHSDR